MDMLVHLKQNLRNSDFEFPQVCARSPMLVQIVWKDRMRIRNAEIPKRKKKNLQVLIARFLDVFLQKGNGFAKRENTGSFPMCCMFAANSDLHLDSFSLWFFRFQMCPHIDHGFLIFRQRHGFVFHILVVWVLFFPSFFPFFVWDRFLPATHKKSSGFTNQTQPPPLERGKVVPISHGCSVLEPRNGIWWNFQRIACFVVSKV